VCGAVSTVTDETLIDIKHASLIKKARTVCDRLQEHAGHRVNNVRRIVMMSLMDLCRDRDSSGLECD